MERPCLASVTAYGQRFTDAAYWRPHVEVVCAWHGLSPCRDYAGVAALDILPEEP